MHQSAEAVALLQLMLMLTFPLFLSCSQLRLGHRTGKFELATCNVRQADCERTFSFGKGAQLEQFQGRPPSANEVAAVLEPLMAAAV